MKTIKILFGALSIIWFFGCQEDVQGPTLQETGMVLDFAGSGNCGFVIETENGNSILPINYPNDFVFAEGQEVWVEYTEMLNVMPLCDRGAPCEILAIEELNCAPYVDLYFNNYDSLARDPVDVHEVYIDGNCLHIKISYSGGCKEHKIDLARMHPWCGTPPLPPPTFEIRHDANEDMCEAYITKVYRFDLSPLKEEGVDSIYVNAIMPGDEMFSEVLYLE